MGVRIGAGPDLPFYRNCNFGKFRPYDTPGRVPGGAPPGKSRSFGFWRFLRHSKMSQIFEKIKKSFDIFRLVATATKKNPGAGMIEKGKKTAKFVIFGGPSPRDMI